jgi:hypothetical protein
VTEFLAPETYKDLCPKCRATLARITDLFVLGLMPDTDDPEAPCMYMGDHNLFCQGSECIPEEVIRIER